MDDKSVEGTVPVDRTVPVAVTARNEERALGPCLDSLAAACRTAARDGRRRLELVAVLDDTTDGSDRVAAERGVAVLRSSGGLVEAQRCAVDAFPEAPYVVFGDADIRVEPHTLAAMVDAMDGDPALRVAYPRKCPLEPRAVRHGRPTVLARALHSYNLHNGFQTPRHYFNGKLFAIRGWQVPSRDALRERLDQLPEDRFYDYRAGMRVDDIYLSRRVLLDGGPEAIREVDGLLWFRPPATFEGMYRTYRRMRMEIERLDAMFPETREAHRRWGIRRRDPDAWRRATAEDRHLHRIFQRALVLCRWRYHLERFYYRNLSSRTCDPWRPIPETKEPIPPVETRTADGT